LNGQDSATNPSDADSAQPWWRLDFKQLLWCLVFGGCLLAAPFMVAGDADLATHIALGRRLIANGFPSDNPVLFSTDVAPVLHEWLFELIVASLDQLMGLRGPLLLGCALAASIPALLYRQSRLAQSPFWTSLIGALLCMLCLKVHLTTRPHLISILFLIGFWSWTLAGLEGRLTPRQLALRVIPLTFFWVNLHGGFILAPALLLWTAAAVGIWSALRPSNRTIRIRAGWLGILGGACILLSGLNPYGFRLLSHLVQFLSNPFLVQNTSDFQAPAIADGTLWPWLLLVGWTTLTGVACWRHLRSWEVITTLGAAAAGYLSVRNIPICSVVILLIVAEWTRRAVASARAKQPAHALARLLVESDGRLEAKGPTPSWAWCGVAMAFAALTLTFRPISMQSPQVPSTCIRAVSHLPQLLERPGYTGWLPGGYLLYDREVRRVFIHPLNANYPPALAADYLTLADLEPGWRDRFSAYRFEWALAERNRPLFGQLIADDCWQLHAEEPSAGLFLLASHCTPGQTTPDSPQSTVR